MEYRSLGRSGLKVPVLSFGTATFGGTTDFFKSWGDTDIQGARRLIDVCLEAGVNFFDTANGYSAGESERILGQAVEGRGDRVLIATKATFPTGDGPNDLGSSRFHLVRAAEDSLRRLKRETIDVYYMHGFDQTTPVEETLRALDDLVSSGKVRYIACSNFSGWHLMKSLSVSERQGWSKYVAHQVYYSLVGRDYESELMPLALDQGVGAVVWSPLAGGALTGKIRRDKPAPANTRLGQGEFVPYDRETLFRVVDAMDVVSKETGKSHAQIALNWVISRPSVSNVIIGARNEEQLRQNLAALDWKLSPEHSRLLDAASESQPAYPVWHQRWFPQLVPPPVPVGLREEG
jgi:aryl-alcohol dehydrogenase-like predicted oxidoreductase